MFIAATLATLPTTLASTHLLVHLAVHALQLAGQGLQVDAGRRHEQRLDVAPQPLKQALQLAHLQASAQAGRG